MRKLFLFMALLSSALISSAQITTCATQPSPDSSTKPYNDRILVVSGGGARGAWGAGFSQRLVDSLGPYKAVFGTSTGALMAPLIVVNDFKTLRQAYTNVNQSSIFNVNPFNKKTGDLKILSAIFRIIFGYKTLGESKNLKKLVDRFVNDTVYEKIIHSSEGLSFSVATTNFKTGAVEIKSSDSITDPEQMRNYIWASANEPLFMSYYVNKRGYYVDGGVRQPVPVRAAINYIVENYPPANHPDTINIDVIINAPRNPITDTSFKPKNILGGLLRLTDIWSVEVLSDNIEIGILRALAESYHQNPLVFAAATNQRMISVHTHYFPSELFDALNQNELLFDMARMNNLWNCGQAGREDRPQLQLAATETAPILVPLSLALNALK